MTARSTIDELRNALRPVFQRAPVYRAVLFGSYAAGCATEQSDIDLVIDSRGELLGLPFFGVLEDVASVLGKPVDMFEASEIRAGSPMAETIAKQGVVLYERT